MINSGRLVRAGGYALLALSFASCGGGQPEGSNQSAANSPTPAATLSAADAGDISKLDGEIARLEREAEKNPGDQAARINLSQAYLRRAGAFRVAQKMSDALRDYQSALRNDPDNEQAQQGIAEISPPTGNNSTGENGEPAPLPITPNVTGAESSPSPVVETPTPKGRKP